MGVLSKKTTDELLALVAGGARPGAVIAEVERLLGAHEVRGGNRPVELTDQDRDLLRRAGLDEGEFLAVREALDAGDYVKRLTTYRARRAS